MKSGRGGKREGAGRPVGATSGRKERITINIDADNLEWLKKQSLSYSQVINKMIEDVRHNERY